MSRSHGEVTVVGDQLKVKACHVNPIFYKRLSGASQVLAKDSEVLLNHLDKFSLMPNEFECEIRVVREETNERNATGEKLDEANNISDPERTPSPEFFKSSYQPMNGSNQVQNSLPDKETSRKRSLSKDDTEGEESKKQKQTPSTLLDTASDVAQSSTSMEQLQPTADESGLEETLPSVNVVTITPDPDGNVQAPTSPSAVTETSRKRSISKDDNDSEAKKQKQMPSSLPPSASDVAQSSAPLIQVQPKSESVSDKIIPVQNAVVIKPDPDGDFQGAASTSVIHTAPNAVVIKSEPTGDSPSSKPTLRPSCEYGIRCYRHTTEHRREFAHPVVDADYRRPDYPPARSDAPYCSFGSSCYRRNPEHFLEFKHPSASEYFLKILTRKLLTKIS